MKKKVLRRPKASMIKKKKYVCSAPLDAGRVDCGAI